MLWTPYAYNDPYQVLYGKIDIEDLPIFYLLSKESLDRIFVRFEKYMLSHML